MSSAAPFRAWADTLPNIVWTADASGALTYFSRRWYDYTGLDREASLDSGFARALHPDDVAATLRSWERSWRGGEPFEAEFRLYGPERDAYRWFLARAEPQRDEDGRVVRWTGTCTEIGDRKRSEQELRRRTDVEAGKARAEAVAALGLEALRARDVLALAHVAGERLSDVLQLDLWGVYELAPGGDEVRLIAGSGWEEGTVGRAVVAAEDDSLLARTLAQRRPMALHDVRAPASPAIGPLLRRHGVMAGMTVVLHGRDRPFGVLGAFVRGPRAFDDPEIEFLETVGHVLSTANERIGAEASARTSERRLSATLDSLHEGFVTLDDDWRVTFVNSEAERILGRPRRELLGRNVWEVYDSAIGSVFEEAYRRARANRETVRLEAPFPPLDRWLAVTADPTPDGLALTFHDVTERRAERERAELFRQFHATLASITEESLSGDLDDAYYERVLDYAVQLVPGAQAGSLTRRTAGGEWAYVAVAGYDRRLLDARLPADEERFDARSHQPRVVNGFTPHAALTDASRSLLYGPVGRAEEIRSSLLVPVRIGEELRAYLNLDNLEERDAFGSDAVELGRLFGRQIGTVMQRMELERNLMHQARTDVVTGVPNRRYAEERLERLLEDGRSGVVLFLDLDDFKHVNEAHGHAAGDELLRLVAARLTAMLEGEASLARWGGDEFMVILPDVVDPAHANARAFEVEARLRAPFQVQGHDVVTSGSVGISLFGDRTARIEQVVREADIALNQAKRLGKRRTVVFSERMGVETSRRFAIERALRDVLASGGDELRVQYQARVESEGCRIVGVEALSRWTHPTLGELSPAEFVPIAETSGLIEDLTRRVLDQAARQARRWQDEGSPRVVSVNLSAACIRRDDIVGDVRRALDRYALSPSLLELEVTETAAMSGLQESVANLEALRDLGVSLSIDDFGTAYSSLTYLRLLPVDTIKVDRSFVSHIADDIDDSPTESSIVKGIVALGRSLGMRVIAEGVETEAQADFLRLLGCDGMQGYYFGRAKPADAFPHGTA